MKHLTTLLLLIASLSAQSSPPHLCDSTFREASSRAMELALKQTKQFNPNNRTMKKIKSTNALNYINEHSDVMSVKDLNTEQMHVSRVRAVVSIAEQDAEERAKVALKHTLKHFDMTSIQRGAIGLVFEESLNNGGQSDV